jgi:tight adherence protein C
MRLRSAALADELNLVGLELRAGASRTGVAQSVSAHRGGESSLVTMLVQADRFGTNVADSLRVHAPCAPAGTKAEEAAAKIPLKLLFRLFSSFSRRCYWSLWDRRSSDHQDSDAPMSRQS